MLQLWSLTPCTKPNLSLQHVCLHSMSCNSVTCPQVCADLKLINTSQVTRVLTCKPSASWWRVPCTGRQILYTLWNLEKPCSGKKGNKTPYMSQVDHQARASSYPSFCSIKWLAGTCLSQMQIKPRFDFSLWLYGCIFFWCKNLFEGFLLMNL